MARRKHHAKKTHRRHRRSMSGVKSTMTNALATIAGAVAGRVVTNIITKQMASSTMAKKEYIAAAAPLVVGLLLPKVVKSELGKNLSTGMIATGGVQILQASGAIGAIEKRNFVALGPSDQNRRGIVAGMTTKEAAILTA